MKNGIIYLQNNIKKIYTLKGGSEEIVFAIFNMIKNSRVRFRNNKPYLLKKIIVTALVVGIVVYFAVTMHWLSNLFMFLFVGLPIIVKISKQPSEGKSFFGKLANFYKTMYKQYVIDNLPTDVEVTENTITVTLHKAERIYFHTVDEKFTISKDDIAGILYDDQEDDILIMFQKANILATDSKTQRTIKKTSQTNSTICFCLNNNLDILNAIHGFNYPIERLSEIEDAEAETDDPELLVNKLLAQYKPKNDVIDAEATDISESESESKSETEAKPEVKPERKTENATIAIQEA